MKPYLFTLLFLYCLALTAVGQQAAKTREERKSQVEYRSFSDYTETIIFHNRARTLATVRTYTKQGALLLEEHFRDYPRQIKQGYTRVWYRTGQLYWKCDFRDNQPHGAFFVFYEDGSLKRREYYRRGFRRESRCFTPEGQETSCSEFYRPAKLPGGKRAFLTKLREHLSDVNQTSRSLFVTLRMAIQPDGTMASVESDAADPELTRRITKVLGQMPPWEPATADGVPTISFYTLNLEFRQRDVYLPDFNKLPD